MDVRHLVLAGDSIFDNDGYVLGEPGVIEQLRRSLPGTCSASKVAVDGDCIGHVAGQMANLPRNATDLIVSVGGNDARSHAALLAKVKSADDVTSCLAGPLASFASDYGRMLEEVLASGLRVHVCTIYEDVPFADPHWRRFVPIAIKLFNDVIVAEAARREVSVLHLERICTEPDDFSDVSPIEPSCKGGRKIVDHIIAAVSV